MNREQVIEWADRSHLVYRYDGDAFAFNPEDTAITDELMRFASFAALHGAAQEREACAELMEQQHAWVSNVAASALIRARGQGGEA